MQEEWMEIAKGFAKRWDFENTLGAIDGKHVHIRCPPRAGSLYYNEKQFHYSILLAVVDSAYKFIFTDIGSNGSVSDTTVFNEHSKTSFEKNCFSAWASTLNMGLINKVDMVCLSPVGYGV